MAADSAHRKDARYCPAGNAHRKTAWRYLIASAGCVLLAFIYAQFSHGVYSPFMTYMFAIPLVGGALPALACHVANAKPAPQLTRQAWGLAIACLTVASCLRGVFEIAGTASTLVWGYPLVAFVLAAVALVAFVRS